MLSLCIITKDEEQLLPACLQAVQDIVDEIIIVDTGSTDRTVEIAKGFGVSVATMQAKAKAIGVGLDLIPFHPDWSLPSTMDDNPIVWMLEVNGILMDVRMAPRQAQVAAYEKGLIPYIPADREETVRNDEQ